MGKEMDTKIRDLILKHLYDDRRKDPGGFGIDRNTMFALLQLAGKPELMDFNMLYLEEKGLVKLERVSDSIWADATITACGIDIIESKQKNS